MRVFENKMQLIICFSYCTLQHKYLPMFRYSINNILINKSTMCNSQVCNCLEFIEYLHIFKIFTITQKLYEGCFCVLPPYFLVTSLKMYPRIWII